MVELGHIEEGMMHEEGDESWKKIVDILDSIKQTVIIKRRESILFWRMQTLLCPLRRAMRTQFFDPANFDKIISA
jgi:hypothetical protein